MEEYNEKITSLSKIIIEICTNIQISYEQKSIYEMQLIDVENFVRLSTHEIKLLPGGEIKILQILRLIKVVNEMIFIDNKTCDNVFRELQTYHDALQYIKKEDCNFQYNQLLLTILDRINKIKLDMDQEIYIKNKDSFIYNIDKLTEIILEKIVS